MKTTYFQRMLAELMTENKISQQDLAEAIGVRQSQISNYLSGKCLPSYYQIQALSNFFNVSADQIVDTKFDD